MNYIIRKDALQDFLFSLKKRFEVIVPVQNDSGASCFQLYEGQLLFLDQITDFSPKPFFRPHREKIFSFKKKAPSYEIKPVFDKTKRILFGVRPCDTHALHALDELFIRYFGEDQFYSSRRKGTIVISLLCSTACENGFCNSMGTSVPRGHDILFIERDNEFFVVPETEAGESIIDKKFFKVTSDAKPNPTIACKKKLKTANLGKNLYANFSHSIWEEESKRCLSCSSCTQVCPTCYCYTTDDEFIFGSEKESGRFRFLDSCQLLCFTKVAGGNVFRKSRAARLRQFILHKLSYFEENHGMHLCIGCGRCISTCPVKIDITHIANTIQRGRKK